MTSAKGCISLTRTTILIAINDNPECTLSISASDWPLEIKLFVILCAFWSKTSLSRRKSCITIIIIFRICLISLSECNNNLFSTSLRAGSNRCHHKNDKNATNISSLKNLSHGLILHCWRYSSLHYSILLHPVPLYFKVWLSHIF